MRVARVCSQIGMAMDLSGIHSDRLCRDAEPHVLGEHGMLLFITIQTFRPPHYRPRREGPFGKDKKEPHILSADGCDVRKDSAYTSVRGLSPRFGPITLYYSGHVTLW